MKPNRDLSVLTEYKSVGVSQTMQRPAFSTPYLSETVRSSILALPQEAEQRLSPQERDNLKFFECHARKYLHRLAWPLSQDPFVHGLKEHFDRHDVRFARLPFASIDTVYYLFQQLDGVKHMMEFVGETPAAPVAPPPKRPSLRLVN